MAGEVERIDARAARGWANDIIGVLDVVEVAMEIFAAVSGEESHK